jgi:hypothetical protein
VIRSPLVLGLLFCGCAHTFPARYDVESLRADSAKWPGEALVHYLSRSGADDTVCERSNFTRVDSALVDPFVDSLDTERVPLPLWTSCAQRLLPSLPEELRTEFLERLARRAATFVERPDFVRLRATYDVFATRPREPSPALRKLRSRLVDQPDAKSLNALIAALRALLELDDGMLNGQPLTEAIALQLDDEALLHRIDARAPDEALRLAARRRIVRLHIAQSTVREVAARAEEVERRRWFLRSTCACRRTSARSSLFLSWRVTTRVVRRPSTCGRCFVFTSGGVSRCLSAKTARRSRSTRASTPPR